MPGAYIKSELKNNFFPTQKCIQHIHHTFLFRRFSRSKGCGDFILHPVQVGKRDRESPFQFFQIAGIKKIPAACGGGKDQLIAV